MGCFLNFLMCFWSFLTSWCIDIAIVWACGAGNVQNFFSKWPKFGQKRPQRQKVVKMGFKTLNLSKLLLYTCLVGRQEDVTSPPWPCPCGWPPVGLPSTSIVKVPGRLEAQGLYSLSFSLRDVWWREESPLEAPSRICQWWLEWDKLWNRELKRVCVWNSAWRWRSPCNTAREE